MLGAGYVCHVVLGAGYMCRVVLGAGYVCRVVLGAGNVCRAVLLLFGWGVGGDVCGSSLWDQSSVAVGSVWLGVVEARV